MAQNAPSATRVLAAGELIATNGQREFAFSDLDFRNLTQLAYEHAGIVLSESKRNLVYSRLSRRLRALSMTSFREYRQYLAANQSEIESFINSISTNHTKFFREGHHFDHLRAHVAIPFSHSAHRSGGKRLRVWSAGCSTGEEPYTIAAVLGREIRDLQSHDVRILATDIDTDVLGRAAAGEYPASSIADVPKPYQEFFPIAPDSHGAMVAMRHEEKSLIAFRRLNLLEQCPFQGLFDAIFCRNVMIYFDGPTKAKLIERFTRQIKPGGWLYIGHSESLMGSHHGLQLVGRTIYRRAS